MSKTLEVGRIYDSFSTPSNKWECVTKTDNVDYPYICRRVSLPSEVCSFTEKGRSYLAKGFDLIIPQPKKLIDWSKMPKGTMTKNGEIAERKITGEHVLCLKTINIGWVLINDLRLAEQTEFTYWGGGDCPVPEGVSIQIVTREGYEVLSTASKCDWGHDGGDSDIIAYRITGLAEGYTDNPEEVVE